MYNVILYCTITNIDYIYCPPPTQGGKINQKSELGKIIQNLQGNGGMKREEKKKRKEKWRKKEENEEKKMKRNIKLKTS